jgi:hypothetical protein
MHQLTTVIYASLVFLAACMYDYAKFCCSFTFNKSLEKVSECKCAYTLLKCNSDFVIVYKKF